MDRTYMRIHPADNTLIALEHLVKGTVITVEDRTFHLLDDIPVAHKFALNEIPVGSDIVKYGSAIGIATEHIRQGSWVHTHNTRTKLEGLNTYTYTGQSVKKIPSERKNDTFLGYRRKDGRVGTRNELWIIPTVSCVNHTAESLARKANERFGDRCDGIFALPNWETMRQ
jgi:altronate hydrolase